EQAQALETEIEQLEGEAKLAKQRELANLFIGGGRLDRAALVQQEIAEVQSTPEEWKRAGDLFYDWMSTLQDQAKPPVAQQAIAAYQRVLEVQPDNHDVRTDMATAYLSSNNPMQGVQEIKQVLDADPNHLHARFNYGIMLALIGRGDQATEQFEAVKSLVGPESSYYQQAEEAIQSLQQRGSL
ncbi:MAG TPA: tetratricopeptide repeat protein, partial [Rhodothermales bacterium]|nr:tetratricopeptide repeat protein [Rhodothermales bacterium]